jgi:hypothetical protein
VVLVCLGGKEGADIVIVECRVRRGRGRLVVGEGCG